MFVLPWEGNNPPPKLLLLKKKKWSWIHKTSDGKITQIVNKKTTPLSVHCPDLPTVVQTMLILFICPTLTHNLAVYQTIDSRVKLYSLYS